MLSAWGNQINATDIGIDTSRPVYEMVLRVTQVLNLSVVYTRSRTLVGVPRAPRRTKRPFLFQQ
jgi:hypothetical protein